MASRTAALVLSALRLLVRACLANAAVSIWWGRGMPVADSHIGAALGADGKFYVVGLQVSQLDPVSGVWSTVPGLTHRHDSAVVADTKGRSES